MCIWKEKNLYFPKRKETHISQKETRYIKKRPGISKRDQVYQKRRVCIYKVNTANPTWGDIFECCFKAQSSKLERLFSLKRGKRDVRALSFELSIPNRYGMYIWVYAWIHTNNHTHTHTHTHTQHSTAYECMCKSRAKCALYVYLLLIDVSIGVFTV